jgi:RecA-family ATPase
VAPDGSKRPGLSSWKEFQDRQPTQDELLAWFNNEQVQGLGVITGPISGNLLMIEFEGRAVEQKLHLRAAEAIKSAGFEELWQSVVDGYTETTPSGGIHFLVKVDGPAIDGNTKLASKPGEDGGCLIETRAAGGFSICAPSGGTAHPSGKLWSMIAGSIETIPTITTHEMNELFRILATFDEMPKPEITKQELIKREFNPALPGDDYNQRTTWEEILEPIGWKKVFTQAEKTLWRRPKKDEGISASTNHGGYDTFYVFSTSTTFEANKSYSKFAVYAHLHHADNFKHAAEALRFKGYGGPAAVPAELNTYTYSPETGEIIESTASAGSDGGAEYLLQKEIALARAKREAKKLLDIEEATAKFKMPEYFGHLGEELQLPRQEVEWTIKDVFPTGANVTLTAQYKAGKTTLINSLARSLADGEKFLNYFDAPDHPGRIVIFNYEVNREQYRRWFDDVGIKNVEKVSLYHMKGSVVPLLVPHIQDLIVGVLKRLKAQTWILDPFAGAFTGSGDENSNSDVTVFLNILDNIKERAGVSNLVIPIHTGRAQEHGIDRARGATRLDDWADVRWILKKTQEGRFFSADGRDVLLEEQALAYDNETRGLTFGGADAYMTKKYNNEELWYEAVLNNPGKTTSEILSMLHKNQNDKGMAAARKSLMVQRKVKTEQVGRSVIWFDINHIHSYIQNEVG